MESTSGNCLEKDAKVEYEEVFDDRRAVQRGNSRLMRRRPERRARAGNKYRAVEVSGGVEKERDYFGRRDDRYDDRRDRDRGYDRRGYDDRDRASGGVPCAFLPLRLFPAQASSATARATATTTAAAGTTTTAATAGGTTTTAATEAGTTTTAATAGGTTTTAATAGATTTTAATTAARHAHSVCGHPPSLLSVPSPLVNIEVHI